MAQAWPPHRRRPRTPRPPLQPKTGEILVTARRREESLQDTPVAISAFSAEMLEERQIQQTQDLEHITPSLQFKPAGQLSGNSASAVVFIRGVGQVDPTAAVDPGVNNLFDERYLIQGNASLATLGYAERIYARPRSWYVQASAAF